MKPKVVAKISDLLLSLFYGLTQCLRTYLDALEAALEAASLYEIDSEKAE